MVYGNYAVCKPVEGSATYTATQVGNSGDDVVYQELAERAGHSDSISVGPSVMEFDNQIDDDELIREMNDALVAESFGVQGASLSMSGFEFGSDMKSASSVHGEDSDRSAQELNLSDARLSDAT